MTIGLNSSVPAVQSTARASLRRFALFGACAGLLAFTVYDADARPGGGGGFRGGGGAGISRSGGFGGLRSGGGLQRPNGSQQRPGATSGQRPNGSGTLGQGNRPATANSGITGTGNGNSANVQNRSGNTGIAGNGNGNTGVVNNGNVNTGNVAVGNDVDVNVQNGGWAGYPAGSGAAYATGVAVGATTTAAVIGSSYYALPSGCYPYAWHGSSYYSCTGTWYQQRYVSGSVTYVVVADPTKTK